MGKEDEVRKAFNAFQGALISNDTSALDRLMAPDYRGYSIRGELEERQAVLDLWGSGAVSMDHSSYEGLEIEVRGDVGIVTGQGFLSGKYEGTGWEHQIHFCDLYANSPMGWQLFLSHSTEVNPFDAPQPGTDPAT